jgi:ligand-binding sensor domain-containing protein
VVRQIHRDAKGLIWIGTSQGLYVWNKVAGKLTKCLVSNNPATSNKYLNFIGSNTRNDIFAIAEDRNSNIWIGTWGHGLVRFKAGHPELTPQYYTASTDKNSLSSNYVTALICNKSGELWAGTTEGINLLQDRGTSGRFLNIMI